MVSEEYEFHRFASSAVLIKLAVLKSERRNLNVYQVDKKLSESIVFCQDGVHIVQIIYMLLLQSHRNPWIVIGILVRFLIYVMD